MNNEKLTLDHLKIPNDPIRPESIDMPGDIHLVGMAIIIVMLTWTVIWFLIWG